MTISQDKLIKKLEFLSDRAKDQKKFVAWNSSNRSFILYILISRNGEFQIVSPEGLWNSSNGGKPETLSIEEILKLELNSELVLPLW